LELATSNASKPPKADREEILDVFRRAARALREGVATHTQWGIVAGAVHMCRAVEKMGVMRGIAGHLQATDEALDAIHTRAHCVATGNWSPTALSLDELDVLRDFQDIHAHQVHELGRAEFERAVQIATASASRDGVPPTVARDLERLAA
jgi:hypothetical protein